MEPRGRGRAGGRARGAQQPQGAAPAQRGPPGPRPGQPRGGPPPARPQPGAPGAWGGRAAPMQQQPPTQAPWGARPPAPEYLPQQSHGRGSRQGGGEDRDVVTSEVRQVSQGGDAASERRGGGNGGVRGRTNRNEILNTRPESCQTKKGSDGKAISLRANYFQLMHATKWGLSQYRVDFNPELDNTPARKGLFHRGITNHGVHGYLFDGTVLYTTVRINPDPLEFVIQDEKRDNANYRVTVRLVGEVLWGDWQYLQLFNIIIRKCLDFMNLKLLGRNYFDEAAKIVIPDHRLELWPGYVTSMRRYEQHIMLNADLSFKVLRRDTVYDFLLEFSNQRDSRQKFISAILGTIVLTPYNNKTYRIDDVDFNQSPNSTFRKRDGSEISYNEYFTQRYDVAIQVPDQPMLISRSKPREIRAGMPELVVLVPELCIMTGLTERQRDNFQLMRALADHTRIGAGVRMQKVAQFGQRLRRCPQALEVIRQWDLQLAENLIEFQGRVLPEEQLLFGRGLVVPAGDEADWTKQFRKTQLLSVKPIDVLPILSPHSRNYDPENFGQALIRVARGMGFQIGRTRVVHLQNDSPQEYLQRIEQVSADNPQIIVCILERSSADKYNAIKKKCYVDRALPCQVVLGRTLSNAKGLMSVATKIAIQMNCKVGGAPWGVSMPKHTMVCGYDVCRDTANRSKSFAGMVASMDQYCSRYFSMAIEHDMEQEISSSIGSFMTYACENYMKIHHTYPERIIIYRDGVGDGQIPYVKEHEVQAVKELLIKNFYKDRPLKMAYIIVSKRTNTKIFRSVGEGQKNDFNPPPGTVVDDVITWPERYDFYLVSQCVKQGTVAPTSYNIIEDTLGVDANKLQRFTYKMCHMYFNWSGTVRVPAPCQYAHKLAFLTSQSLHRGANQALRHTLYYL